MSNLYWPADEQIARLHPFFPKSHGRPRVNGRRVPSGIVFVNRNALRCTLRMVRTGRCGTGGNGEMNEVF